MSARPAVLCLLSFAVLTACDDQPDEAPPPPAGDAEQAAPMPGGEEMDPEMMALMMEAQELQQELGPIQEQALQDGELANQRAELQERVESAMREENAELLDEMEALEAQFMAAQEEGDQERLQEIGMEAQGIEMELQALQQSVLDRPDIRADLDAFEDAQRARMMEIDPDAGELLDRMDEILAQLEMH